MDKQSVNSEVFNKTEILGQMFDDENESVKDMIKALKNRNPHELKNRPSRTKSPMNSQADRN